MFFKTKKASATIDAIAGDVNIEVNAADGDNVAISDGTNTLDVNTDGSINVVGTMNIMAPTGPFKITTTTVVDTANNPLPTPLTARVSLSIRNKSETTTVYVGTSISVTADNSSTGGWEIGPGEDFHMDLNASNVFFLIAPAGQSALIKLFEVAST